MTHCFPRHSARRTRQRRRIALGIEVSPCRDGNVARPAVGSGHDNTRLAFGSDRVDSARLLFELGAGLGGFACRFGCNHRTGLFLDTCSADFASWPPKRSDFRLDDLSLRGLNPGLWNDAPAGGTDALGAAYGVEGLIKLATATLSIATAVVLWPLIPKLVALPSPAQLEQLNAKLSATILEQEHTTALLRASEARGRTANVGLERWGTEQTAELREANAQLTTALAQRLSALQALAISEEAFRTSFEAAVVGKVQVDPASARILRGRIQVPERTPAV
jgi:hypothetical protein